MAMVGVLVGHQHTVEPVDLGIDKLLTEIGRGVDQDAGEAGRARALDQERGPPPAIPRVVGIASAPAERRTRHAHGRPAAEDGETQAHAATAGGRGTLLNRRKKFSVVWRAISSGGTPRTSAKTWAVSTT